MASTREERPTGGGSHPHTCAVAERAAGGGRRKHRGRVWGQGTGARTGARAGAPVVAVPPTLTHTCTSRSPRRANTRSVPPSSRGRQHGRGRNKGLAWTGAGRWTLRASPLTRSLSAHHAVAWALRAACMHACVSVVLWSCRWRVSPAPPVPPVCQKRGPQSQRKNWRWSGWWLAPSSNARPTTFGLRQPLPPRSTRPHGHTATRCRWANLVGRGLDACGSRACPRGKWAR